MVFIKSLNKNILPKYLPPFENELFSSWLCRLAINHEVKTNTFFLNYFGRDLPLWTRDIDVTAPKVVRDKIFDHTPLSRDQIDKMFLISLEGYAFERLNIKGHTKNILANGIRHRKRINFGQLCCPKCFKKGKVYYKIDWRLATSIVCLECNEYLIDRCFICKEPITFFRVNIDSNSNSSTSNRKELRFCSNCNTDLSLCISRCKPREREVKYQQHINETITKGYNSYTQFSFLYVELLLFLAYRSRSSIKNNRFRSMISDLYNWNKSDIDFSIESWNIEDRKDTLPIIHDFLMKPTNEILAHLKRANVVKSYITGDHLLPYWFQKYLNEI